MARPRRHRDQHRLHSRPRGGHEAVDRAGANLNFIGDEGGDRVEAAFGAEKYARLTHLKRECDPTNLFRHNQNIRPADVD